MALPQLQQATYVERVACVQHCALMLDPEELSEPALLTGRECICLGQGIMPPSKEPMTTEEVNPMG